MTKSEAAHLNCIKMFRAKSSCGPADVHFLIGLIDSLTPKLEIAEGTLRKYQAALERITCKDKWCCNQRIACHIAKAALAQGEEKDFNQRKEE